jgi:predicted dinucleotide-binding enzyme
MSTKQTIAIIGASGNMGAAIAKNLAQGNYRLLLCSAEQGKVQAVVENIISKSPSAEVEAIGCSAEASWEADIIISAVPYLGEKEVAERIRTYANQKIVISISNPFSEPNSGVATEAGTSAAEELQRLLPHSKVVKAFSTTLPTDFASPFLDRKEVDVFIAGNDEEALQTVSELVSTAGFNTIIAGDLSVSRTFEKHAVFAASALH